MAFYWFLSGHRNTEAALGMMSYWDQVPFWTSVWQSRSLHMYFLSPGWQWSKGLDSQGESALLKAFPAPTTISEAHIQDVWWLMNIWRPKRERTLAPTGYGFWAVAGLRSENNCILSRWSQLLCDYYFRLLCCVSAERILVLIDEGFLSDSEIQLTSQLKLQWELPWSVWGLIPALFQVSHWLFFP